MITSYQFSEATRFFLISIADLNDLDHDFLLVSSSHRIWARLSSRFQLLGFLYYSLSGFYLSFLFFVGDNLPHHRPTSFGDFSCSCCCCSKNRYACAPRWKDPSLEAHKSNSCSTEKLNAKHLGWDAPINNGSSIPSSRALLTIAAKPGCYPE